MKTKILGGGIVAALLLGPGLAHAGPYGDDLSKCLVSSTTSADKALLVKWIFSAISLNPEVAKYVEMPEHIRTELNKETAGVYMHLMTESCKGQMRDAFKYEGAAAINSAFQLLGQIAGQEIFADPVVAEGMTGLTKHFDEAKLAAILNEK